MPKSAEELKERLQKVSQEKNLGKLTYRIQKTSAENTLELVLHFENFKRTGKFAFAKDINKQDSQLVEDLADYLENIGNHQYSRDCRVQTRTVGDIFDTLFATEDQQAVKTAAEKLTNNF